jgi:hypothetical protein
MIQLPPNTPDLAELDYPKATKALIKIMRQKMDIFAEADTELAELQDNITQAQHNDAVALKAAAIAGEPDPGTASSDAAARAVLYQEQVAAHARSEVIRAGVAVRKSIEEHKLVIVGQSLEKAETGVDAWQHEILTLQADYARAVENRRKALDGMRMIAKMGLTRALVNFEGHFPVSGDLRVPIIREEYVLGLIETLRKVVLEQATETGEFNKRHNGPSIGNLPSD